MSYDMFIYKLSTNIITMGSLTLVQGKAIQAKKLLAKETDDTVYSYIDKNDKGVTQYDLMKALNWSSGKVRGALLRLYHDGYIYPERVATPYKIKVQWFPKSEEELYKKFSRILR